MDADQIIRTDMGELYDMDIKGRPLAYTPFCDNNKEMDGYRFWRQVNHLSVLFVGLIGFLTNILIYLEQGFWREHLRGRPYHIR